uniref:Reverse transcriptase domain-containing protein n=1 Tax=Lepeophtheirus salmonis TaxID=72036 RepID=A0A0K2V794_LEPSM
MGFHHIRLNLLCVLTTFITPIGRYKFNRLPFGISSGPEVFLTKLCQLLDPVEGVHVHIDDILITGIDKESHDNRLKKVQDILKRNRVQVNEDRCIRGVTEVKILGYVISADGIKVDPGRIRAPTKVGELRSYLGMVNQIAKFCS